MKKDNCKRTLIKPRNCFYVQIRVFNIFAIFLSVIVTRNIFALGNKDTVPANGTLNPAEQQETIHPEISDPVMAEHVVTELANIELERTEFTITQPSRAEQVVKALAQAYPMQIERIEFRNNDWAILLRDTWYYYAGGKLLPENLLENADSYSSQPFYNYQTELPPWRTPSPEEAERYHRMSANRSQNPPRRSPHFFDDLWRARNHSEAYDRVKTMRFLGKSVTVHFMIMENLSLVEETILTAARTNSQVQAWINNINSLEGWSWRNIADTQSRSYHSYGLAIDILPRSYGGRETYWLWTSRYRSDWWNVSYNERFHPPQEVIKAFEKYGFIWGGKWAYYDTMHFEYRPEILILSGMPPETRR